MFVYFIYFIIGNSLKLEKLIREFILYRLLNNLNMIVVIGYNLIIFKVNKVLGFINMKI